MTLSTILIFPRNNFMHISHIFRHIHQFSLPQPRCGGGCCGLLTGRGRDIIYVGISVKGGGDVSETEGRTYLAIDLKSFYASVECIERGLDPMTANLVVADLSRTDKTICLAVSPALKSYGIPGRIRLFEVAQRVAEVNRQRLRLAPGHEFTGRSCESGELAGNPSLAVDYHVARPRMALYMDYSSRIYEVYLKYVSPDDIHVYSIDEVFIDVTAYLKPTGLTARELAVKMILDVQRTTGITAAAGIGTNLYLCKIAMDIGAKHIAADPHGVRIAELDERGYRRSLWEHRPLTDFWRVGPGTARKLEAHGMHTMGDVARCSLQNEALLYKLFGVNAELLIDHAWGWEPCTIADIKAYRPSSNSVGAGQVLQEPYPFDRARVVLREMADSLAADLLEKGLVTDQLVLTAGYDRASLAGYEGEVVTDRYGRRIPRHAHGTANLDSYTSSASALLKAATELFERIVDPKLLVRRMYLTATHVIREADAAGGRQLTLFDSPPGTEEKLARERSRQEAVLKIRKKYGKNAILKGLNFEEGATGRERNRQIGGHKA